MTFALAGLGADRPKATATDRRNIGRDQFLELLVTQLRHQDPLSPLAPDQFAAQLAQFTSVEQLTKLNDAFSAQHDEAVAKAGLDKAGLGASLIGHQVVVRGDFVAIGQDGVANLRVNVGGNGGAAKLHLLDSNGHVIETREIGAVRGGSQQLRPLGDLPPGTYRYSVEVTDNSGKGVEVIPYTQGTVDGVIFDGATVMLKLGAIRIPLDNLSEITH